MSSRVLGIRATDEFWERVSHMGQDVGLTRNGAIVAFAQEHMDRLEALERLKSRPQPALKPNWWHRLMGAVSA